MTKAMKLIGSALLLWSLNTGAQTLSADGSAELDRYLQEAVDTMGIPGMVALVVNKEGVVYEKAFGKRDHTNNKPMTTDTIFRIASMTKPITSTAVMMLVEEGKVELDAPISTYLPELANRQVYTSFNLDDGTFTAEPAKTEMTVRHLLTNTSGLGYSFASPVLAKAMGTTPGARARLSAAARTGHPMDLRRKHARARRDGRACQRAGALRLHAVTYPGAARDE